MKKKTRKSAKWMDISVPVHSRMLHYPNNPTILLKRVKDLYRGDHCTVSKFTMGTHTGTHIDAPSHFVKKGLSIDKMPLDTMMGHCRVLPIKDKESIKPGELIKFGIKKGERILFKTENSKKGWKTSRFNKHYVYLSTEAALYLASTGIHVVGFDYLSAGGYKQNNTEVHRALLENGIWIIEGLNLSKVTPGHYHLIALPLHLEQAEAAPARAILERITKR